MSDWQPIETYPREYPPLEECSWGDEAILWVPACEHLARPHVHIGWLEADMWLGRDHSEPECCAELCCAPTNWMPLPSPPTTATEAKEPPQP